MHLGRAATVGMIGSLSAGASLFIVFRVSVDLVGTATLGNWIMIQSLFIFARLPEAGIGVTLTRLVAIDRPAPASPYLAAGALLNVLPIGLVGAAIALPVVGLMIGHFQSRLDPSVIRLLVGLSLCYAIVTAFATVTLSVLEGLGGINARNLASIGSNALLAGSIYPLILVFGVVGIALAYLASAVLLWAAAHWLLLRRSRGVVSSKQSRRNIVARLWRQSAALSVTAVVRLAFEPWAKFMVGTFGGLVSATHLDFALRVTTQVRVAIQAGTQPLLAFGAREKGGDIEHAKDGFRRAQALVVKANIFLVGVQISATTIIAMLGFGYIPDEFAAFFFLLATGSSLNSLGVVGYYYDVTAANMRHVLNIQIVMMVTAIVSGSCLAFVAGPIGFVAGYALAFAYGGFALARSWLDAAGDRWIDLLRTERMQAGASLLAILATVGAFIQLRTDLEMTSLLLISIILTAGLTALFAAGNWRILHELTGRR